MNYNYKVKQLDKNIDINCKNIYLAAYTVNTSGKYPFLQYLLSQGSGQEQGQGYSLPQLPIFQHDQVLVYSILYLSGLLQIDKYDNFTSNIEFDGMMEYDSNIYLFFDLTKININIDDKYSSSIVRFALIDEIVNHKHICHFEINPMLSDFFSKHEMICFLYDNNRPYEIPIVGFVGKPTPEQTEFTYTFGEISRLNPAPFGSFFYFTNFYNAIRQGGWSSDYKPEYKYDKLITCDENGKYIQGGIVRFALFTENIKYIENMTDDNIDQSNIKKTILLKNRQRESQTSRITDYNGIWANEYDSVYIGILELDDGSIYEEAPLIVLREYNQQIPLSFHFIKNQLLGNKFDATNLNYTIQ